ncbi:MAG: Ig domain-containing protein [Candidatus Sericytochromatia bacterium]
MRRPLAVLLTLGVVGCNSQASVPTPGLPPATNVSHTPAPQVSYPPEPPESAPYLAPSFPAQLPEHLTGRWEPFTYAVETIVASPTPEPTQLPKAGYIENLDFDQSNPVVGDVGATLNLKANVGLWPFMTWGVLDLDEARGRIDAFGRLTLLAPGPVRVYAERGGTRRYMLVAARAVPAPAELLPVPHPNRLGDRPWSSWLQSEADWTAYWTRSLAPAHPNFPTLPVPPVPANVDFAVHGVLAMPGYHHPGQDMPVVTHVTDGPAPIIHLSIPDRAPSVSPAMVSTHFGLYRLPKLAGTPRVEITGVDPRVGPYLELAPPEGPPTPAPSPTPDPRNSVPPRSTPRVPPFPPPSFPTGTEPTCPPRAAWSPGSLDIELHYAELRRPRSGNEPDFVPVLTVGGSLRLTATSRVGAVRWRVADPARASIDAEGLLTAHRPGAVEVFAEAGGARARALVPVVAAQAPALRYRYFADWMLASDAAPRTTGIVRDDAAWKAFWRDSFRYPSPDGPPSVDFSRYDVVTLVHDRPTWNEREPVLTHMSDNGTVVHLAYPGIESSAGIGYTRTVYMYLTGKLRPDARVAVHTLCDPTGAAPATSTPSQPSSAKMGM